MVGKVQSLLVHITEISSYTLRSGYTYAHIGSANHSSYHIIIKNYLYLSIVLRGFIIVKTDTISQTRRYPTELFVKWWHPTYRLHGIRLRPRCQRDDSGLSISSLSIAEISHPATCDPKDLSILQSAFEPASSTDWIGSMIPLFIQLDTASSCRLLLFEMVWHDMTCMTRLVIEERIAYMNCWEIGARKLTIDGR